MSDDTAPRAGAGTGDTGRFATSVYGVYAWVSFIVCFSGAVLFALAMPGLERRRRWVSAAARSWFTVAGIRTTRTGLENIPAGHCIVVANHASYMDGVILQAYLPPRFSFVVKGEMRNVPVASILLQRIGSKFVERFVAAASARDALTLLRAAVAGECLAFFPEGTFHVEPGLHRFHSGAFAAAIKGRLPVVPLAIRGSRQILPARKFLPRHGHLHIAVLDAIHPTDASFRRSTLLAEMARQRILAALDEPDLALPTGPVAETRSM
ncbi:MAG: lysophospholipid acyltransferase family protein [Woeseiaceae bacterium]